MKRLALIAFFLILALILVRALEGFQKGVKTSPIPQPTSIPVDVELFYLINNYRRMSNLPEFTKSDVLCEIAKKRSSVPRDFHKGFLEEYRDYPYRLGENVTNTTEPHSAFMSWRNSPPHNAAMLADWKYACVACNVTCVTIFSNL